MKNILKTDEKSMKKLMKTRWKPDENPMKNRWETDEKPLRIEMNINQLDNLQNNKKIRPMKKVRIDVNKKLDEEIEAEKNQKP